MGLNLPIFGCLAPLFGGGGGGGGTLRALRFACAKGGLDGPVI